MSVRQIKVGDQQNFVYLLVDDPSGEAIVIDSGWEIEPIVTVVRAEKLDVKYAVATHHHSDHTATLWQLGRLFDAKIVAHKSSPTPHDLDMDDGDALRIGGLEVKILHTPGHTEDSICLYDGREVFTGDMLFVGTIGKFDRERAEAMYTSLHDVILRLPASTVMYPGHDYGEVKFRTLGEEKASNPFLMTKDLRSFLSLFG